MTQDVTVGSIVLEPFGYVCTMHDRSGSSDDDTICDENNNDNSSVQRIFKKDKSNYSRLIQQDDIESSFFNTVEYGDMLETGHAGSRAIVSKIEQMYLKTARDELIPKVLLHIQQQMNSLQTKHTTLGVPLPPPLQQASPKVVAKFKHDVSERVREILLDNKITSRKSYAVNVLEPLMSSVLATATGKIEFVDCLNPVNSVDQWLKSLRSKISAMCAKSVEKAQSFWCEFIERLLNQDESTFRLARFRDLIAHIIKALQNELASGFENVLANMENCILDFLETVNQYQGVSVRYHFVKHEKVTLCWDSDALAHSLVYHLTREGVMLTPEKLIQVTSDAIDTIDVDHLKEQCEDVRAALRLEIGALENHYRKILSSLDLSQNHSEIENELESDAEVEVEPTTDHFCSQLKSSGLRAEILLKNKFPIEFLREGSFSVRDLIKVGVAPTKLYKAGYSVDELRGCNLNLSVIIGQAVQENKTLTDMIISGFTFRDLEDFGYDFVLLLGRGCKKKAKVHVLKALLLLDLSNDEKCDLNKRDIISTLLTFFDDLIPEESDDEVGRKVSEEDDAGADDQIKEAILSVLCKLYDGSTAVLEKVQTKHVIAVQALINGPTATASSTFVAVQALRMMTSSCVQIANIIVQTGNLLSILRGLIRTGTQAVQLEVMLLLRNLGVTHIDSLVEGGFVTICLDCLGEEYQNYINDSTKTMAAFNLYMLASSDEGCKEIIFLNGMTLLSKYFSQVLLLAGATSDECTAIVFRGISMISFQEGERVEKIVVSDAVVEYLCKVLNTTHWSRQEHLLSIVLKLCLSSPENKKAFGDKESVVRPLVDMLEASKQILHKHAIKMLILFVENNSAMKLDIAKKGGITHLLQMLGSKFAADAKIAATTLLIPLAAEASNSIEIVKQGAVDLLLDMLNDESDSVKEAAAATMRSLAYVDENRIILADEGAIGPLVDILRDAQSASCKIMATRTLRNLAFNCNDNKLAIANQGGVEQLVAMLHENHVTGDMGKIVAAGVLQNLAYKIPENVMLIIEAQALPLLGDIILHGSSAAKEAAAGTVRNIASDENNCILVFRSGVLESLIGMFRRAESAACATAAREALRTIAQNDMCRTNMKLAGIKKKDINFKRKDW